MTLIPILAMIFQQDLWSIASAGSGAIAVVRFNGPANHDRCDPPGILGKVGIHHGPRRSRSARQN